MAPITYPDYSLTKIEYTFEEAIEYMKMRDRNPTDAPIRWRSVKTGKEVVIGYVHSPNTNR